MTQNKARRTNKIEFLQLPWAQEVPGSNPGAPTTSSCVFQARLWMSVRYEMNLMNCSDTSRPSPETIHHRSWMSLLALAAVLMSLPVAAAGQGSSSNATEMVRIEGIVVDANGQRVANALVFLEEKGGARLAKTTANADGTFVLSLNHAGTFALRAEKTGLCTAVTQTLTLAAGEKKHVDLVLASPPGAKAENPGAPTPAGAMELQDEPSFTVAGVTDWSNVGLHSSDTNSRTSEGLAKDTLKLKSRGGRNSPADAPPGKYDSASECIAKGDFVEAREQVRKALAAGDDAEGHRLLGDLDERLGDPLDAVREYERAARMYPSEQNYFDWGSELLLHKAVQPAVEVFTTGSGKHPDSARMLAGLGAALYAAGSYDEAARRLCEASDKIPSDPAPYLFLGKMEKTAPVPLPCSEEKLSRFVQDQPANALANYYYAVALWKKQRGSESPSGVQRVEALLEKAVTLDPKLGEAYVQLGILYAAQGGFERAIPVYKKAIEVNPDLGEAHYRLSLAYKRIGEESKAHQEFQEYKRVEQTETATIEQQRRELGQFLIILKNQPAAASPR